MAAMLMRAPSRTRVLRSADSPASRIAPSWSPISAKMTPFSTKMSRRQTALDCIRVAGATAALKNCRM